MKSIALYLFSLCFACTTLAQELASKQASILLYMHESAPPCYADGEKLAENEVFRVLFCRVKSDSFLNAGEIPFDFDKTGQLIPGPKLDYCAWGAFVREKLSGNTYYPYVLVDVDAETGESLGVPVSWSDLEWESEHIHNVVSQLLATESTSFMMSTLYAYLIVMDTRVPVMKGGVWQDTLEVPTAPTDATAQFTPTRVNAWSATLLATPVYGFGASENVSVNYTKDTYDRVNFAAMTAPSAVTSLTIDNILVDATDGENDEEDQATIDVYLSPSVAGLVADADGNYTLTASSSDQILYKLQTRESLSEGDWQDVDTWLASFEANTEAASEENAESAKKELANDSLPCYNRLRIGQGSSIPLPRVLGEPTRFYRLKSE